MERYIKQIFNQYYNGEKNPLTPKVYGYDVIKTEDKWICFEKSRDEECTLYGVSTLIYTIDTGIAERIDLAKPFNNSKEARKYIKELKNKTDEIKEKINTNQQFVYGEKKEIFM